MSVKYSEVTGNGEVIAFLYELERRGMITSQLEPMDGRTERVWYPAKIKVCEALVQKWRDYECLDDDYMEGRYHCFHNCADELEEILK